MTIVEYTEKKNQIIYDTTGIWLIPKSQFDENVLMKRTDKLKIRLNDVDACPYCNLFKMINCTGCPMSQDNNKCGSSENNTYDKVINTLKGKPITSIEGIIDLVDQFNKEL